MFQDFFGAILRNARTVRDGGAIGGRAPYSKGRVVRAVLPFASRPNYLNHVVSQTMSASFRLGSENVLAIVKQ